MKRVLHVLGGLDRGGAESMVMNLYRNIDRKMVQFDFVIHTSEKQAYYEEILELGGKIYHFPAFNGKNFLKLERMWIQFFIKHPEYKILHSHVRSYAALYLPIAKKHGVKTIIHSHATSNGKGIAAIVKKILQYPLRHQADSLMSCSKEAGIWLYGEKACAKANHVFLPNAIDTEKYCFSDEIAVKYRKELGLEGKFVIGHVGRFHEAKNHMFLLDIFAAVCEERSDAMLLLVGDGPLREKIEWKIRNMRLNNRVILTGSRGDVPQLLQAMDVFAFPSLWEGLPVTLIETQASGMPCLISDCITKDVDVSELIMRLPINDADKWVNAVLTTDTLRRDVINQIKQSGFDIKNAVDLLMNVYNAL